MPWMKPSLEIIAAQIRKGKFSREYITELSKFFKKLYLRETMLNGEMKQMN